MKKILINFLFLANVSVFAQTPTYKWISGSQTIRARSTSVLTEPGPRQGASTFIDTDGNYWLFGGYGNDAIKVQGFMSDTWKYDRSSGLWEWIGGQMTADQELISYNNSLLFDGVDDIISLPANPIDYTQDLTIEFWFKPFGDGAIMSYSAETTPGSFDGWRIELVSSGSEIWIKRDDFVISSFTTSSMYNEWHHFAITFADGDNLFTPDRMTVYLDGEVQAEGSTQLLTNEQSEHQTYIGGSIGDNDDLFFYGQLDEVRFWDYARNQGEISSNMNIQLPGDLEGLAAYYDFNQGSANSAGNNESQLIDKTGSFNGALSDLSRDGAFIGQMAKVRLWDYAFDIDDVKSAINTFNGTDPGTVIAYDFDVMNPNGDNTTETVTTDLTATYDGTLTNFALDGDGSNFSEDNFNVIARNYVTESGSVGVVAANMNSDADAYPDVISATSTAINVFINDGTGLLGAYTSHDVGSSSRDITVGYWNDDAYPDIAVAAWEMGADDDRVRIFFGDGSGGVTSTTDVTLTANSQPQLVRTADVDKDLNDDLIIILAGEKQMAVYYGDGVGGFSSADFFDLGLSQLNEGLVIDDFNNDTYPDVAVSLVDDDGTYCGKIGILLNDAAGSYLDITYTPTNYCLTSRELQTTDYNDDGNKDIILIDGSYFSTLTGNGDGTFTEVAFLSTKYLTGFLMEDTNSDGIDDIVAVSSQDRTITIYTGDENGEFVEAESINIQYSPDDIILFDLDQNGVQDFIVAHNVEYTTVVLREGDFFEGATASPTLDFDGLNDYVEISGFSPFDASFTWEGWVKTADNGPLFSFTSAVPEDLYTTGQFAIAIKNGLLSFMVYGYGDIQTYESPLLLDDKWHHLAVSVIIDGSNPEVVKLYVDGIELGYEDSYEFSSTIDLGSGYTSKLGYASADFKNYLGSTAQSPTSNWVDGIEFPLAENGRSYNAYWNDSDGNFFIFGGKGESGIYNALRQFDEGSMEWLTIKGSDSPDDPGSYGVQGVSDISNNPPARWAVNAATDASGYVWMFGGATGEDLASQWYNDDWYNDLWRYDPVSTEWMWVSGTSSLDQLPTYGTQGVSDVGNIPGARENSEIWTDSDGNIWVFGGYGIDSEGSEGYLNDLWMFNTNTLEWTWIGGSNLINQGGTFGPLDQYNATNYPGSRGSVIQWMDSEGLIWMFGGIGYDKFGIALEFLNDLWSYDPTTNQWAWHSGSDFANSTGSYNEPGLSSVDYVPGARWHGAGWIDEYDDLWLFGGYKFNQLSTGLYNDFWKYETSTKEWTWYNGYSGTANSDEIGVYGDLNDGSLPHPGSRHGGLTWMDPDGVFWILGGAEIGSNTYGFYNDLWKYEPDINKWTYVVGNTELSLNEGVYGSKGIGSATNDPKSRWHGASWLGQDGKLWFFGGINNNEAINNIGWLNDLWYFDPESEVYTWMGGSSTISATGVYGIKGQSSTGHIPGARSSSAYWSDADGYFWLFGGYESFEFNNDLWKFNPNTLEWTWVSGNNFQNSPGVYGELGVPDESNSIGARRYTEGKIDQDGNVWIFGGDGYDSQAQFGWLGDLWKYDPEANIWTWMSGSKFRNTLGSYGTMGVASADNNPPPRYGHSSWIDDSGNIWIFGGFGFIDSETYGEVSVQLNDLWKFDVKTNMWTWIGGSNDYVTVGEFGVQGQFDENNIIFRRARAQTFGTYDKSLWIFGGRQSASASLNDFWQISFTPALPDLEDPSETLQSAFTFAYDEPWATAYNIQVALSDDFSDTFYDQTVTDSEVSITGLNPGTYYYYRVDAINDIGNSGFTPRTTLLTLPATPTFASLALALSDLTSTQVYLDWEVTEGILDGYYMDVSQDPTFTDASQIHEDFDNKVVPKVQRQEVLNLEPGTKYYTRLRSYNASGTSPYSVTVPFLTKPATPTYDLETVLSDVTQSGALLTWNAVPETLSGYRLTISTLDDGFTDAGAFLTNYSNRNINKTRTDLEITGLEAGTYYFGKLVSYNASGESDPSEKIIILTSPESPVFDLETSIISIDQTEVIFNWQSPSGIYDGYLLEVSTDFSFANTNLMLTEYGKGGIPKELGQSVLTETVSGLLPGQTYYARVRAFNDAGTSPNSNILSFTTVPSAPTINTPNNITQTGASINWSSTTGSEVYLIDLNTSETFDAATAVLTEFPLAVPFIVIQDLTPGIRYYARIQSSNESGNSGAIGTEDYGSVSFITIPATPVLNDLQNHTQNSFTLTWPEAEGATSYVIDASDNFFQTFLAGFNQNEVTTNEVIVSGLNPGITYQVRVRAKNESGTSPNASIFDGETLPATPTARDASNVSSSVFSTNWDPAAGADYYVLEVSKDNFSTFHFNDVLTSSNPVQMTGLMAGSTYKYRIKAGNTAGFSPYSNVITVVAQNNAQSLNISNVDFNDRFGESATSTTITATLSGGLGDPEVLIRYKGILSPSWSDLLEMSGSGNTFTFAITNAMLDEVGVEFEIYANDQITFVESTGNKIKRSFNEAESSQLPSLVFSEWQMIAIPYVLDNKQVTSIFNELTTLEYKKGWRLMHYDNGGYLDAITGFTSIEIGVGYWLNVINEVSINVGAGNTNSEIPFPITLKEGWNQIGNPFNTTINWNEILIDNNVSTVDDLFIYDVSKRSFSSSTTLAPFTGAYVWADAETPLEITPASGNARISVTNHALPIVSADGWELPFIMEYENQSLYIAGVGMHDQATDVKDAFDLLAPPRFENFIEMVTTHEDAVYPYFMRDVVNRTLENVWSFSLASNHLAGMVTLKWEELSLDRYFGLWLVDEKTGKVVDMKATGQHQFYFNGTNDLTVHYSEDPSYVVLPKSLTLGDPYPNPAQGLTTIPLMLPEQKNVELSVYDINGRKVKTLVNGELLAGFHLIEWNPSDKDQINSGIYFYRLVFTDGSAEPVTRKLIIKK